MVDTTAHADLRARKRIGVSDVSKSFEAALVHGLHQRDLKGKLRGFITKAAAQHRSSAVIYKGVVYWYAPKGNRLITVIPLSQKWHKYIKQGDGSND